MGIYLIKDGGELVEMNEAAYDSEELLQALLARHPSLLAGGQIDPAAPRRWLLVTREASLPDDHEAAGRWSVDHLFLDQDAIPTLVEVKRSTDTRIRREVVGQMLDYAANAVMYWPVEVVRAAFESRCVGEQLDPQEALAAFLDGVQEPSTFWQQVKTNLQAGKIRMLFVADVIPRELQRIVEFLNAQMDPAEMLAVEIKQFVGSGQKTLVPRVVGQTAEAQRAKAGAPRATRQWDEPSFFAELERKCGGVEAGVARELLKWVKARATRVWWGQGGNLGSFVAVVDAHDREYLLFAVYTNGSVEIHFQYLKTRPAFLADEKRLELAQRLNTAVGTDFGPAVISRRPSVPAAALAKPEVLAGFLKVYEWVLEEIRRN